MRDLGCTPLHSPHGGETAGKGGLCQGRVRCAAKRSQSLDTSRFPAMLVDVGTSLCGFVRNIFDSFLLAKVPLLDRGKDFVSAHVLSCSVAMTGSVPMDSPNLRKSTSRHFRRFMQSLRYFFEVEKAKYFLYTSNKRVLHGFYTKYVLVCSRCDD